MLATKFGMDMDGLNGNDFGARGSRRYIVRAVEASLRRLDTDYIDLYQMHEPDEATPIDETLAALDDLVRSGKVRYLGNSNFAGWQIADADWTARAAGQTPFISAQNQYSLLHRDVEAEVVPACEHFGLGLLPFFPLDSGLLSGKYQRGEKPPEGTRLSLDRYQRWLDGADWDTIEALTAFGAERGHSLLDVAIAGLGRPARRGQRDRRRDDRRAGAGERRRRRLAARRGDVAGWTRSSATDGNGPPRHGVTRGPQRVPRVRRIPRGTVTMRRRRASPKGACPPARSSTAPPSAT